VAAAQASLAALTGRQPRYFRAPGLRNPFLDPVLARLDLQLASWTRRAYDTRNGDPASVLARLSKGSRAATSCSSMTAMPPGHPPAAVIWRCCPPSSTASVRPA
jgi:peptidoglycan/xylan/chitin deacetylase (PgdA/CDA1 family)